MDGTKRRMALIKFLRVLGYKDPKMGDIKMTCSWDEGEYKYKERYFSVHDLNRWTWGDDFYKTDQWMDIDGVRVSQHYYIVRSINANTWTLYVGGELIYIWRNHKTDYKPKTKNQIRALAKRFIAELKNDLNDIPKTFSLDVARATIEDQLWKLFGKW